MTVAPQPIDAALAATHAGRSVLSLIRRTEVLHADTARTMRCAAAYFLHHTDPEVRMQPGGLRSWLQDILPFVTVTHKGIAEFDLKDFVAYHSRRAPGNHAIVLAEPAPDGEIVAMRPPPKSRRASSRPSPREPFTREEQSYQSMLHIRRLREFEMRSRPDGTLLPLEQVQVPLNAVCPIPSTTHSRRTPLTEWFTQEELHAFRRKIPPHETALFHLVTATGLPPRDLRALFTDMFCFNGITYEIRVPARQGFPERLATLHHGWATVGLYINDLQRGASKPRPLFHDEGNPDAPMPENQWRNLFKRWSTACGRWLSAHPLGIPYLMYLLARTSPQGHRSSRTYVRTIMGAAGTATVNHYLRALKIAKEHRHPWALDLTYEDVVGDADNSCPRCQRPVPTAAQSCQCGHTITFRPVTAEERAAVQASHTVATILHDVLDTSVEQALRLALKEARSRAP